MGKVVFGTMMTVCIVLCIGYVIYRRNKKTEELDVKDVLKLQDIFDWIDIVSQSIVKSPNDNLELNILPNADSQKLTKQNDERVYVALLKKGEKVLSTKIFYATTVDVDLAALKDGKIVIIPID